MDLPTALDVAGAGDTALPTPQISSRTPARTSAASRLPSTAPTYFKRQPRVTLVPGAPPAARRSRQSRVAMSTRTPPAVPGTPATFWPGSARCAICYRPYFCPGSASPVCHPLLLPRSLLLLLLMPRLHPLCHPLLRPSSPSPLRYLLPSTGSACCTPALQCIGGPLH